MNLSGYRLLFEGVSAHHVQTLSLTNTHLEMRVNRNYNSKTKNETIKSQRKGIESLHYI